ncbi:RadC family protein [Paenibacillus agricola]|uniref:DNA repair protein RadC n=1 Tax=Paenibacillus agricola TaxID=2716264 RepID=A0ABX0JJA5_9BACL|nr:DNA repair protein RadC [Paenibacillus agricola]NHN35509.1 DNA repair protein RadC [Paenibacillus agricola]
MMYNQINKNVIRGVKETFYKTCDASKLSNKDLLILVLEPLLKDKSISMTVDEILQKGMYELADLSEFEISTLFGLTEVQSFHLMAVFELAKRFGSQGSGEIVTIRTPENIAVMASDLKYADREHFVVFYLDTKNHVIGRETISTGSLNAGIVHPREVFKRAIRRSAASIIAVHNHPSGDPTASKEDVEITHRLCEAGELIGISLLDHIIIGHMGYESLKEKGHLIH